jgi:glutamate formiminotransferase/formiminotetrahydrofolate cyclodeaminase
MEETAEYAHKLAKRVGEELNIPVYCYENAAKEEKRRNLASCRAGEYEGLSKKLVDPNWKPDYGPAEFNERVAITGATAISARDFLVAINYNLNTTSTRRANALAFDVREKGRPAREGGKVNGKPLLDEKGEPVMIPGTLKATKAIGWFIDEYGIAQVSMNITNVSITPVHTAFEEVSKKAQERGLRVTGSEIVGLVPKKSMVEAGKYFLKKQQRSVGVSEDELIKIAVKSMGLDDLKPYNPQERIIEYLLDAEDKSKKLIDMTCKGFADETASESPAPGGGSISAYLGALGASLGTMVANLASHKAGWDDRWEEFSDWAEKGQALKDELLFLVDEDTHSFNKIMDAFGLPKSSDAEKATRTQAIQDATKYAIEVPYRTMEVTMKVFDLCKAMVETGNPASVTDAGVGALCARTAVIGAFYNVKINCNDYNDKAFVEDIIAKGNAIQAKAIALETEILKMVDAKL